MKWLEKIIHKIVAAHLKAALDITANEISEIKAHIDLSKQFERKLLDDMNGLRLDISRRLQNLEEFKSRMDEDFVFMTKAEFLKNIDRKQEIFREEINKSISDVIQFVRNKVSNMKDATQADLDLLKKVARLEELQDAITHRRSTQELLEVRKNLQKQLDSDQPEVSPVEIRAEIRLLSWILGEEA